MFDEREWNDDWRKEMEKDYPKAFERFCNAQSTKSDLLIIAKYIYKYNKQYGKEDCLDKAILWVSDWNNQTELVPLNYNWYLQRV